MEKVLKLYTYLDGVNDSPFPSLDNQIEVYTFRCDYKRMGATPSITCTVMCHDCLDNLWTDNVYAEFNGEKFFLKQTPTSSYDNTDSRYKHELELVSERIILDNVYFYDVVDSYEPTDKPVSNSSKFTFFGTINEFAQRLNQSLEYSKVGYRVVVDNGISSEGRLISFENQFFSNALQEAYKTYEIPYYFVGKEIHIGFTDNAITHTFKYGSNESLLSIQKQNANYKVVNRVTGVGSADNIPYYYPNDSEYGEVDVNVAWDKSLSGYDWDYDAYGDSELTLKDGDIVIVNPQKFAKNVGNDDIIISYAHQWRRGSIDGPVVRLSDIGVKMVNHDKIFPNAYFYFSKKIIGRKIPTSPNLLPSIYRETIGKERFYNAVNDTYLIPNSESFYEFANPYIDGKPKEHIVNFENIKPSIVGIINAGSQRIDMFSEFAYDENDNDEMDEEGNYIHPYFFGKLRRFDGEYGFNLFERAIDEGEMTISMTSGNCGGCEWVIGVDEDTQKNIVQVNEYGNLLRDDNGNVKLGSPQERQNDTSKYEVWVALKKDINTFGVIMPNATRNYRPNAGDTFVILHIDLPKAYILAAEKKLEEELIKYMAVNNSEKFNFSISFSRIFFAENPDILEQLNENARIQIEYDNTTYELYISSYSYSMSKDIPLPEIRIELSDTLTISQNALQTAISDVKNEIISSIGGSTNVDFLKQGLRYFLRKDKDDTASGNITFKKQIKSDDFVQGLLMGSGWSVYRDANGNTVVEADRMVVRKDMTVSELVVNQETFNRGGTVYVKAGCTITRVDEYENFYRCYYDNENGHSYSGFKEGDQARSQRYDQSFENLIKYYWRLVVGVGEDYVDLSKTDCDGSGLPEEGDDIAQLGNRTDKTRQSAIVISPDNGGSVVVWAGINSFELSDKNMVGMGVNSNTGRAYLYGYGDMFFGDRNLEGNFITYQIKDGDTKPTMVINADVQLGAKSTGLSNLSEFRQVQEEVGDIKGQIEREFTIWFFDPEPTLDNKPAVDWVTDTDKNNHDQDLYYSDVLARAWRFVGGEWVEITDERTLAALKIAEEAESKAKEASDYVNNILPDMLDDIQKQIDERAETWYQDEDPSLSWNTEELKQQHVGDLWYDKTRKQSFMWTGSEWITQGVPDEVFDTIDGKASIYTSKPSSYKKNDLWILAGDTDLDAGYKAGTIVVATESSDVFVKEHWTKLDRYTDDTKAEEAYEEAMKLKVKSESFEKEIEDLGVDMELIKEQTDREFTIWYGVEEPTLENEPAKDWVTEVDKNRHDQDLYYSDSLGKAWRFVDGEWIPITDERTIAALNKAQEAYDKAKEAEQTANDLNYLKSAFGNGDEENVFSGGIVMSKVVGVINNEGEVEAFMNGSDFAKDESHGKLILAGGIPSTTSTGDTDLDNRAKEASIRIYEDGSFYAQKGIFGGFLRSQLANVADSDAIEVAPLYNERAWKLKDTLYVDGTFEEIVLPCSEEYAGARAIVMDTYFVKTRTAHHPTLIRTEDGSQIYSGLLYNIDTHKDYGAHVIQIDSGSIELIYKYVEDEYDISNRHWVVVSHSCGTFKDFNESGS